MANQRVVLAGGPGAGKTSVIERLQAKGHHCAPDVARSVIRARLAAGLSPRPAPDEFARAVLAGDIANYEAAPADRISFFERGVVDALGSLRGAGELSPEACQVMLDRYPYHPVVLLFPPWGEIYRTDAERDQTFTHAVAVYGLVKRWYELCGYNLLEVPRVSVDERVAFVERAIADTV